MAMKLGSDSDGINEINITPFVDIVLVLLILFMISTPALVQKGARISLPKGTKPEDITHVTLNLKITKEGDLWLDNRKITTLEMDQAFDRLQAARTASDAILSADVDVSHGRVMELVDRLRARGIQQIAFATDPKSAKSARVPVQSAPTGSRR